MLDKTLPRMDNAPFDAELIEASTHLLLFVHNVAGMAGGLYFFLRNEKDFAVYIYLYSNCTGPGLVKQSAIRYQDAAHRPQTSPAGCIGSAG
jgi:hypothetical protein